MSSLLPRTAAPSSKVVRGDAAPSAVAAPIGAAVRAAAAGLIPILVPVVLSWVLGAGNQATWTQAVRLAVAIWLLAHHTGLVITGGHVGLVPLGLPVVPLLACWFAGRRLARTTDPQAEKIAAGATRAAPAALSWRTLLAFGGAYCLIVCLASLAASMPGLGPVSAQALLGSAVISLVGGGLGALSYRHGGVRAGVGALWSWVPTPVQGPLRAAAAAVAVWVGGAAALVGVLIAVNAPGVLALHRALDTGYVGGCLLAIGELMLLPNLIVWGGSVLAGPGFALGSGTSITVAASSLGSLPAVPVLAALPAPGPLPVLSRVLLLVPLLAGAAAGVVILSAGSASLRLLDRLAQVGGCAAACGVLAAVLSWLSGGPAGPGRLAVTGPNPLVTGLAIGAWVGAGAALTVLAVTAAPLLWRRVRALRRGSGESPSSP